MLMAAMLAFLQKTLKVVPAPLVIEAVPKAPPVLEALNLMILCISRGSYNSTNG